MADVSVSAARSSRNTYAYDTFTAGLVLGDLAFLPADPGPGDSLPLFDLELVDGGRISNKSLGDRAVVIVFGSLTCPVTESSGAVLNQLHRRYGERVRFLLVNTREAHPGQDIPQPRSFAEKRDHARQLRAHHRFAFEVAVDSIDGDFHRAMGPKPNSAYLVRPDGIIAYRAHWANDGFGLEQAISAILSGSQPRRGRSSAMLGPLLRAIGHLPGIVRRGGSKISRDLWLSVPPFAVMALLTRPLPFLPPDTRGPAALLAMAILVVVAAAAWIALLR